MKLLDYIPVTAWILSLIAVPFYPETIFVVLATSVNLLHARWTNYNSGIEFTRRVRGTLTAEFVAMEARLALMEKGVADVKDAQLGIAGAFRGRGTHA